MQLSHGNACWVKEMESSSVLTNFRGNSLAATDSHLQIRKYMIFVRVLIRMMCLAFNVGLPPSMLGGGF